jgi:hypothetical protein
VARAAQHKVGIQHAELAGNALLLLRGHGVVLELQPIEEPESGLAGQCEDNLVVLIELVEDLNEDFEREAEKRSVALQCCRRFKEL